MTGMRYFTRLALIVFSTALVYGIAGFPYSHAVDTHMESDAVGPGQVETIENAHRVEADDVEPEPQRLYCAEQWTRLYKGQKADITVTTRGQYNEIAVFSCPDCSLDEHYVRPFLETEYRGETGLTRLHECGFTKAVFKGMRGTETIVVDVPRVFPDPNRLVCINDWSRNYQKNYPTIQISSRGELNEVIVFSCLNCPFQKSFIAPFLLTVSDGRTAMERMKECGFTEIVFTNPMGTREVVREVR
jgi:RNase P subunit RPR2